jgi:hypothetical protein
VSIQLPSQLETIADYAFQGCIDLGSITIPNSVKQIIKKPLPKRKLKGLVKPRGGVVNAIKKALGQKPLNLVWQRLGNLRKLIVKGNLLTKAGQAKDEKRKTTFKVKK